MSATADVRGGFTEPVFQSQTVFKAVMDAMARPGTICEPVVDVHAPTPLGAMAAAVALSLVDADTPLWLGSRLRGEDAVRAWLSFHTGAPFVRAPDQATFAIASDSAALPVLSAFCLGSQEYPDRSTTLILQVETLKKGRPLILRGPGIKDTATLAPDPLPPHFLMQWNENNQVFPRGVELILAGPTGIACLPRTTRIAEEGE